MLEAGSVCVKTGTQEKDATLTLTNVSPSLVLKGLAMTMSMDTNAHVDLATQGTSVTYLLTSVHPILVDPMDSASQSITAMNVAVMLAGRASIARTTWTSVIQILVCTENVRMETTVTRVFADPATLGRTATLT